MIENYTARILENSHVIDYHLGLRPNATHGQHNYDGESFRRGRSVISTQTVSLGVYKTGPQGRRGRVLARVTGSSGDNARIQKIAEMAALCLDNGLGLPAKTLNINTKDWDEILMDRLVDAPGGKKIAAVPLAIHFLDVCGFWECWDLVRANPDTGRFVVQGMTKVPTFNGVRMTAVSESVVALYLAPNTDPFVFCGADPAAVVPLLDLDGDAWVRVEDCPPPIRRTVMFYRDGDRAPTVGELAEVALEPEDAAGYDMPAGTPLYVYNEGGDENVEDHVFMHYREWALPTHWRMLPDTP